MDIPSEIEKRRTELVLQQSKSFPRRAAALARAEGLHYEEAMAQLRESDGEWIKMQLWRFEQKLQGASVGPMPRPRKARATKFHF